MACGGMPCAVAYIECPLPVVACSHKVTVSACEIALHCHAIRCSVLPMKLTAPTHPAELASVPMIRRLSAAIVGTDMTHTCTRCGVAVQWLDIASCWIHAEARSLTNRLHNGTADHNAVCTDTERVSA